MVSNHDITGITGLPSICYSDLGEYKLSDIMPFALLYRTGDDDNNGHWTCIIEISKKNADYGDILPGAMLFDPVGNEVDDLALRKQISPKLLQMMLDEGFHPHYNEYRYQRSKQDINTCGRWVIYRLLNKDLSNNEFHSLIKEQQKKRGISDLDDLIVALTSDVIGA